MAVPTLGYALLALLAKQSNTAYELSQRVRRPLGYFWTARGYEYALLWCLLSIGIFFRGGGRYSVDRLLGKEF